jgi:hypothetical protein
VGPIINERLLSAQIEKLLELYFCRCEGQQGKKPKSPEEVAYNEQTLSK